MQLLVACAWCERIKLDGWVEPAAALRQLRTYEWPEPPRFSHGICDRCADGLARKRGGSEGGALAA
jgi:hypothetical protein